MNFYHQRKKVYKIKANQIVSSVDCTEENKEVTINNNVYINESLTMSLLIEARKNVGSWIISLLDMCLTDNGKKIRKGWIYHDRKYAWCKWLKLT